MKKIVILGSGAGGTMVGVKLRKELSDREWQITIIDNDEMHHYQPGWLFIPFGIYKADDCMKPKRDFIPKGVKFIMDEVGCDGIFLDTVDTVDVVEAANAEDTTETVDAEDTVVAEETIDDFGFTSHIPADQCWADM